MFKRIAIVFLAFTLSLDWQTTAVWAQQKMPDLAASTKTMRKKLEEKTAKIASELDALAVPESLVGNASRNSESEIEILKRKLLTSRARVDAELTAVQFQLEEEFKRQRTQARREATLSANRALPEPDQQTAIQADRIPPANSVDATAENHLVANTLGVLKGTGWVTAEVIDHLRLADNLYSIGETENALEVYQQLISKTKDHAESPWIKYQIASCYRRLKKYDEATTLLRELVNEAQDGLPVRAARWWLAAIEKRKNIENDISLIEQLVTELKGELDEIDEH